MTVPSGEPPKLILPGHTAPTGDRQLHVTNAHGTVQRTITVSPTPRTDPGFYRRLIQGLDPLRQSNRAAMAVSGLGTAALALDVAATLNMGNPFLFYLRRELWKEMSGTLEGSRSDLWRSFFDDITPNWKGLAQQTLQQYVRFNINGLYGQLGKISGAMSSTMHSQYKEVMEYDLSVFGLYAASAPILRTIATMSTHPVGRAALMTQVGLFMSAAGNLVKQFADVFNKHESELNKLELKLNDLRGAFYRSGDPARGARDLHLTDAIADPRLVDEYWVPMNESDAPKSGPPSKNAS
ncbi:hypothetical protein [Nonomuraea roseoviolacea]|uniref:WXG100 family type VII secretion target n=1 Tax=Nonomuraea roseoviolacea subsp. carminata TaxID=160689 RepID=A0ABT1JYE8_9ACTN|nr:hypothetical protein [Nonomuraea roseoviolacea]MCP2346745.1 hypothetical protein [Nonomuraea roseoviolacea subsp. carminata]